MIVCSSHVGPSTYFAGSGRHSAPQILTKVTEIVNYSASRPGSRHDPPLGKIPECGWKSKTAEIHEALIGIRLPWPRRPWRAAARAYFVPKQMWMMGWMKGGAQVPTFSDIRCRTTAQASTNAAVNCTFNESQSSMMGNPDSFWNIAMVRGPEGTWLIDNYGQG
jgi:hypothetical protein